MSDNKKEVLVEVPVSVYPSRCTIYANGTFRAKYHEDYRWRITHNGLVEFSEIDIETWQLLRQDVADVILRALAERILLGEESSS